MTFLKSFPSKVAVDMTTSCWVWSGYKNWQGYGMARTGRTVTTAHRLIYEHFSGEEVPPGMHVDHLCRNRFCVNYLHMEVVTPRENKRRSVAHINAPRVSHCPKGHALDGNSYVGRSGGRTCKICCKRTGDKRRQKIKEERAKGIERAPVDRNFCERGHLKTEENIYIRVSTGARECRTCLRMMARKRYHAIVNKGH